MNAMISFSNDWTVFFTRPISGTIMALALLTMALPLVGMLRQRRAEASGALKPAAH